MPVFKDQTRRTTFIDAYPKRIISLVPSQTELLADLGLSGEVVGITKFCVHPDAWFRSKPRVGGTKQLNMESIHALQPDLIIANKEENVKEQIEEEKLALELIDKLKIAGGDRATDESLFTLDKALEAAADEVSLPQEATAENPS